MPACFRWCANAKSSFASWPKTFRGNLPGQNEQNYPLIYINEKIETLTGYSREQLIRREVTLADLIHPDDHADSGMLLDGLDLTPADKYCFVYRVRHRSGIWRWVEDVGSGAYDSQGSCCFLKASLAILRNVFSLNSCKNSVPYCRCCQYQRFFR